MGASLKKHIGIWQSEPSPGIKGEALEEAGTEPQRPASDHWEDIPLCPLVNLSLGMTLFQRAGQAFGLAAQTQRKTKPIFVLQLNGKCEPSVGVPSSSFAALASIKQHRKDPEELWKWVLALKSEYSQNISLRDCLAGPARKQRRSSAVIYRSQVWLFRSPWTRHTFWGWRPWHKNTVGPWLETYTVFVWLLANLLWCGCISFAKVDQSSIQTWWTTGTWEKPCCQAPMSLSEKAFYVR